MCNKSAVNNSVALLWDPVRTEEERREENMGSCSAKTKKGECCGFFKGDALSFSFLNADHWWDLREERRGKGFANPTEGAA